MTLQARRIGTQPRPTQHSPEPLTALLGPDLPRAACKGHSPLFDAAMPGESTEQRDERHHTAIRICRRCPERTACLAARLTDSGLQRDHGVYGGQVFAPPARSGRVCGCGEPIPEGANPRRKHCTDECRWAANKPAPTLRRLTCPCGTAFTTTSPVKAYCTTRCQRDAQNAQKRQRARRATAA